MPQRLLETRVLGLLKHCSKPASEQRARLTVHLNDLMQVPLADAEGQLGLDDAGNFGQDEVPAADHFSGITENEQIVHNLLLQGKTHSAATSASALMVVCMARFKMNLTLCLLHAFSQHNTKQEGIA